MCVNIGLIFLADGVLRSGMEAFKGDYICLRTVLSEISERAPQSSDSTLIFLRPLWDRNTMWFGGRMGNILFESCQHGIGEFIHLRIYYEERCLVDFASPEKRDQPACIITQFGSLFL
jgi:hypothetical protein